MGFKYSKLIRAIRLQELTCQPAFVVQPSNSQPDNYTLLPLALCVIPLSQNQSLPDYQLAFFTPGMRPAEAISRNWMREMAN